ncbi:hypothetical protein [Rodentibacter genomosp. 2]
MIIRDLPFESERYVKVIAWHERSHFDHVQQWLRNQVAEMVGER